MNDLSMSMALASLVIVFDATKVPSYVENGHCAQQRTAELVSTGIGAKLAGCTESGGGVGSPGGEGSYGSVTVGLRAPAPVQRGERRPPLAAAAERAMVEAVPPRHTRTRLSMSHLRSCKWPRRRCSSRTDARHPHCSSRGRRG